jgi:hypothetical protein
MKDQRLTVFRGALEGLIESLNAAVRVDRWSDEEPPPEPLRIAASKLLERLGTAGRLASGTFSGSPADMNTVSLIAAKMKRLDAAYVTYRKSIEVSPGQTANARQAAATLEAAIGEESAHAAL